MDVFLQPSVLAAIIFVALLVGLFLAIIYLGNRQKTGSLVPRYRRHLAEGPLWGNKAMDDMQHLQETLSASTQRPRHQRSKQFQRKK